MLIVRAESVPGGRSDAGAPRRQAFARAPHGAGQLAHNRDDLVAEDGFDDLASDSLITQLPARPPSRRRGERPERRPLAQSPPAPRDLPERLAVQGIPGFSTKLLYFLLEVSGEVTVEYDSLKGGKVGRKVGLR